LNAVDGFLGDVAYANWADLELMELLEETGFIGHLTGYAGWNTSVIEELKQLKIKRIDLPWNRLFEIDITFEEK